MRLAPPCYNFFIKDFLASYELRRKITERLLIDIKEVLNTEIYKPDNLQIVIGSGGYARGRYRGSYNPELGMIVLYGNNWCRKTLIHELLHAISAFTHVPGLQRIAMRVIYFNEGLTELLTGYILFTKYKECYNAWIEDRYSVCSISYKEDVRVLGAAAQMLISLSDFIKIYVYNPGANWNEQYHNFLDKYGMNDFLMNKPRKQARWPFSILFKMMVIDTLREKMGGKQVEEFRGLIEEAPLNVVLDYSKMIK